MTELQSGRFATRTRARCALFLELGGDAELELTVDPELDLRPAIDRAVRAIAETWPDVPGTGEAE